jgi:hypothetical protein
MHFHCTSPSKVPAAVGNATSVVPLLVYGTSNKLPPPAAAVVVMVIAPEVGAMSMLVTFLVAPGHV